MKFSTEDIRYFDLQIRQKYTLSHLCGKMPLSEAKTLRESRYLRAVVKKNNGFVEDANSDHCTPDLLFCFLIYFRMVKNNYVSK